MAFDPAKQYASYDDKNPWGKPGGGPTDRVVPISDETGMYATHARSIRKAMERGERVSLEDAKFLAEREEYIQRIRQGDYGSTEEE